MKILAKMSGIMKRARAMKVSAVGGASEMSRIMTRRGQARMIMRNRIRMMDFGCKMWHKQDSHDQCDKVDHI